MRRGVVTDITHGIFCVCRPPFIMVNKQAFTFFIGYNNVTTSKAAWYHGQVSLGKEKVTIKRQHSSSNTCTHISSCLSILSASVMSDVFPCERSYVVINSFGGKNSKLLSLIFSNICDIIVLLARRLDKILSRDRSFLLRSCSLRGIAWSEM